MAAKAKKRSPLAGRKVVLGVTGSIAAYKACELTRLFAKAGAEVAVVMTRSACEFVAPLTFRTLSRRTVALDSFENPSTWVPGHVSLADWCDLMVVAPCTANVAAKMACGLADDLLTSLALACRRPKLVAPAMSFSVISLKLMVVAPAMNDGMWENPATQENLATLRRRGIAVMEPGVGELACGTDGRGRMPEPAEVFSAAERLVRAK